MIAGIMIFPLLPLALVFELFKRLFFIVLYPMAYLVRAKARTSKKGLFWLFWAVLDDTIVADSLARCGLPLEYCCYGKREPLGFLTERLPEGRFKEFMRAFGWGAIRNNGINLEIWLGAGTMEYVFWGIGSTIRYEVRKFTGLALPYFEATILGFYLRAGWLTGGRFESRFRRVTP